LEQNVSSILENAYANTKSYKSKQSDWLESKWKNFKGPEQLSRIRETGVSMEVLKKVGSAIYTVPENFTLHPSIARDIKRKKAMIEAGEPVDWYAVHHYK
jgi:2-oxoglutarate dehydrogenase E1 component